MSDIGPISDYDAWKLATAPEEEDWDDEDERDNFNRMDDCEFNFDDD